MRIGKIISATLAGLALTTSAALAGGATAQAAPEQPVRVLDRELGGINFDNYCRHLGYQGARSDQRNASSWYCYRGSERRNIDYNASCRWGYPSYPNAYARYRNVNNPNSWYCLTR